MVESELQRMLLRLGARESPSGVRGVGPEVENLNFFIFSTFYINPATFQIRPACELPTHLDPSQQKESEASARCA